MNKPDVIELLAAKSSITYSEAKRILNALSQIIYDTLRSGSYVNWQGFGRFSVFNAKATLRRNPQTKKLMELPAYKRAKFVAGQALKRAVKN